MYFGYHFRSYELYTLGVAMFLSKLVYGQQTLGSEDCTYSFVVPTSRVSCSPVSDKSKSEIRDLTTQLQLLKQTVLRMDAENKLSEDRFQRTIERMNTSLTMFVAQLNDQHSKVKNADDSIANLTHILKTRAASGGAVYTRWGRTSCPHTAVKLYNGIAGASHYSQTGGGGEKLCLPLDPEWGNKTSGFQSSSYMYGAEYEVSTNDPFSKENAGSLSAMHDQDVPCSVCHTLARSSHVMIPAKRVCPYGWTKEYEGYLMAEHHSHHRSSFDCMDGAPEARQGGGQNLNGALFYIVEASCGALPCAPYVEGWELTCVVCTK